jgi:pimeloyl-ACP methyl ester carboxylesterase
VDKRFSDLDCSIHYLDAGASTPERRPLIFLHGWGLEAQTFAPSLRLFAQERRAVYVDLPGFGRSRCRPAGWDYASSARIIARLVGELGLGQVHLAGHSIGAGVCIQLCAMYPELVLSLTLVDSAGLPFGSLNKLAFSRLPILTEQFVVQSVLSPRGNFRFVQSMTYNLLFNTRTIFQALNMPIADDLRATLRAIHHPTLILWGEKDRTTPLPMAHTFASLLPQARLEVVPGWAYHEWSILYPHQLHARVSAFLGALEQARAA